MLLLILDNCVGQNKSKVVFMFYALLSLLFYDKVTLLFLIPGHSHNQADCVVAWCRNKMRAQNLYTPARLYLSSMPLSLSLPNSWIINHRSDPSLAIGPHF
jgi:hypothetical protein